MVQGISTDGYASLLVIHAASGWICHLTGKLGTLAHLEHDQAASVRLRDKVNKTEDLGMLAACWCHFAQPVV
jgi:hypothetical protein